MGPCALRGSGRWSQDSAVRGDDVPPTVGDVATRCVLFGADALMPRIFSRVPVILLATFA